MRKMKTTCSSTATSKMKSRRNLPRSMLSFRQPAKSRTRSMMMIEQLMRSPQMTQFTKRSSKTSLAIKASAKAS